MQHKGVTSKTGWLGVRIMCLECSDMSVQGMLFQGGGGVWYLMPLSTIFQLYHGGVVSES